MEKPIAMGLESASKLAILSFRDKILNFAFDTSKIFIPLPLKESN